MGERLAHSRLGRDLAGKFRDLHPVHLCYVGLLLVRLSQAKDTIVSIEMLLLLCFCFSNHKS